MIEPLFPIMLPEELIKRYAAGQRNFAGIRLNARNHKMDGTILRKANFSGVEFDVNIKGTDFTGCIFNGCHMSECTFNNTIMREAELYRVRLFQTVVTDVDMSHARLCNVEMSEAFLKRVNLH